MVNALLATTAIFAISPALGAVIASRDEWESFEVRAPHWSRLSARAPPALKSVTPSKAAATPDNNRQAEKGLIDQLEKLQGSQSLPQRPGKQLDQTTKPNKSAGEQQHTQGQHTQGQHTQGHHTQGHHTQGHHTQGHHNGQESHLHKANQNDHRHPSQGPNSHKLPNTFASNKNPLHVANKIPVRTDKVPNHTTRGAAQPTKTGSNPSKVTGQKVLGQGASQPTRGATQSSKGVNQPTRGATQSSKGTTQPTKGATQSSKGTTQPTKGVSQPTRGATQSSKGTAQPTRGATQSTKGTTQPTRGVSQPTQGATQSSKGATQPTRAATSQPTKAPAQSDRQSAKVQAEERKLIDRLMKLEGRDESGDLYERDESGDLYERDESDDLYERDESGDLYERDESDDLYERDESDGLYERSLDDEMMDLMERSYYDEFDELD